MRALEASYVAGFLDGDGSIHFQFVRQEGVSIRVLHPIECFVLAEHPPPEQAWSFSRSLIGGGYLRDRGTGMSDLVVTSRLILLDLLFAVEPYVVFKTRARTEGSRSSSPS